MKPSRIQLYSRVLALLKRYNACGYFLLSSFAVLVASLVLSNNYNLPPKVFSLMILPAAFFSSGSVLIKFSGPRTQLSVSFATRLVFSLILFAALTYVIILTVSSWSQPDLDRRMVDKQWVQSAEIILFMTITALAVAFIDRFLIRLIAILVPLIAISAAINVWGFLKTVHPSASVIDMRLINWLGMPGYTNATNISLTYAVFLMAAVAAMVATGSGRLLRFWLAPFAAVLLVAMLMTQARSAYIGTLISASIVLFSIKDLAFWKRNGLKLASIVVIAGVALGSVSQIRDVVTNRGESLRIEIWKTYLSKATAKPMLGYGGLSNIDVQVGEQIIDQPHNLVLSSQIRGGMFSMLAMLTMLAASAWAAFRFQLRRRCAIPLAMIATIIPTGMFDYNLLITNATWPWLTFWLPFAVCAGAEIVLRDVNPHNAAP